jgi:TIR domain
MAEVFISYSRKDEHFAETLASTLAEQNRDAWVDKKGIETAEDWLQKIFVSIEEADNFVFVVSPDSISSDVCKQEIDHAVLHNKRIIALVLRNVSRDRIPEAIRRIQ